MKRVQYVAYRYLTASDFFNMYKRPGTEHGGGGQLYVDFPTAAISAAKWRRFFTGVLGVAESAVANGPQWTCPVNSIGLPCDGQEANIRVFQRRPQSFCIANQNIYTRGAQRIPAWLPENGFPGPENEEFRGFVPDGLVVYIARTYDGDLWAGWFERSTISGVCRTREATECLSEMMNDDNEPGSSGLIQLPPDALFLRHDARRGIFTTSNIIEDASLLKSWFDEEDESGKLRNAERRELYRKVRSRNMRAVRDLKKLYRYQCQVSGRRFVFETSSGGLYVEAHHVVPLGEEGADHPYNIIVVSAHIHRMLHYANVHQFELRNIAKVRSGWGILPLHINDSEYHIRWHPQHMSVVQRKAAV